MSASALALAVGPCSRPPAAPPVVRRLLAAHLETFLAWREEGGRPVPGFIERALRRALACQDLSRGFCRVRCATCGHETLLGFPCRDRGFCPTCMGRRMNATALHLVDRVLPDVPYRQWVFTLPFRLRRLVAANGELCTAVQGVFVRKVFAWLRRKARDLGAVAPQPGAVVAQQLVEKQATYCG